MRWETRAQGVKKDRAGLAQPVAVCEMSVQHLRGAGTVCEMTMQRLHGLFTVCKMSVQHLHSPFTVCEMTMQHLHSLVAVCETAMQHLHSLVAVCETAMQPLHSVVAVCETAMQPLHSLAAVYETAMQPLHSLVAVCETTMQPLHSLAAVCETAMQPLHSLVAVCAPVPRRLIIRPRLGPSGGGVFNTPLPPGTRQTSPASADAPPDHSAPSGTVWGGRMQFAPTCTRPNSLASADAPHDHSAPSGPVWEGVFNTPLPGYQAKLPSPRRGRMQFAPTPGYNHSAYMYQAKFAGVRRRPSADALHLPHTQIFNVYEEQQTTQHNADDGARSADRSAELAAPQATR